MSDASRPHNPPVARPSSSVIVLRRDTVLMVKRARPPFEGLWSFPGGRAEPGEDVERTARRELLEETGLEVGPLTRLGAFQPAPKLSPGLLTVFAARGGGAAPNANDDALEAEYVAFDRVLARPATAGAVGWIARALLALSEPPLL
jgi:8-oxo-dGTP pyrophosphatase MutT (NUDIX family)